ncbi:tRNA (adenosine(37)-N6)-threonylcarbamoyltransferase complex transferase subunit TsaD [Buchnera aphidicola (Thelaxes californica)]|uniref:tRNA N6-adenosine threonylcarbamoyltransferase n=1 Tax=Buchnera aphidicola (Thelaxes californica) TaxID=1315998 RepID=A0A4D6YNI7_9GAMM|nr:tRNA (adenosine(37)-N6)-threonylcarbamoyltransferase complex transferase subunit TsaD [Buchnera aphidicola]QCI26605.1 tRNA (adenosine(37)-N6)-threonylcarbamoyltransferase complex transferase subunit TsaD [Buchnera aphidicola (Thelaxes californica)]
MRILGIETSCDDTGIAIYDDNLGLLNNQLHNQAYSHSKYGGVVPEIAARKHLIHIVPLIKKALKESSCKFSDIDAIAYTAGPGLPGSLMIGAALGHSLAYALNIPIILVNHIEAHLLSFGIEKKNIFEIKKKFPFIGLIVSGGHTQLVHAKSSGEYEVIGKSKDDSVGEVIDKVSSFLGLGYPGGVILSKLAKKSNGKKKYVFPRPMTKSNSLDFSFSGLKTSVFTAISSRKYSYADISKYFQEAWIDTLVIKSERAMNRLNLFNLVVSGGVSSNDLLRSTLFQKVTELKGTVSFVNHNFCTDNAAMIAYVGLLRLKESLSFSKKIRVYPKWSISDVTTF